MLEVRIPAARRLPIQAGRLVISASPAVRRRPEGCPTEYSRHLVTSEEGRPSRESMNSRPALTGPPPMADSPLVIPTAGPRGLLPALGALHQKKSRYPA